MRLASLELTSSHQTRSLLRLTPCESCVAGQATSPAYSASDCLILKGASAPKKAPAGTGLCKPHSLLVDELPCRYGGQVLGTAVNHPRSNIRTREGLDKSTAPAGQRAAR